MIKLTPFRLRISTAPLGALGVAGGAGGTRTAYPTLDAITTPTNDDPVAVTGTAVAGALVRIYVNGVADSTVAADGVTGAFSGSLTLAEGEFSVTATAASFGELESYPSVARSVEVDRTGPTLTLELPATSESLTVAVTITGSADAVSYYVSESSSPPDPEGEGWGAAPTSWEFSADGMQTLYAWAKDALGNRSNAASDTVEITLPSAPILPLARWTFDVAANSLDIPDEIGTLAGEFVESLNHAHDPTWANWQGNSGGWPGAFDVDGGWHDLSADPASARTYPSADVANPLGGSDGVVKLVVNAPYAPHMADYYKSVLPRRQPGTPAGTYTLDFWIRAPASTTLTLPIGFYNLGSSSWTFTQTLTVTQTWQHVQRTFVMPASGTLSFGWDGVTPGDAGTYYIHGFRLDYAPGLFSFGWRGESFPPSIARETAGSDLFAGGDVDILSAAAGRTEPSLWQEGSRVYMALATNGASPLLIYYSDEDDLTNWQLHATSIAYGASYGLPTLVRHSTGEYYLFLADATNSTIYVQHGATLAALALATPAAVISGDFATGLGKKYNVSVLEHPTDNTRFEVWVETLWSDDLLQAIDDAGDTSSNLRTQLSRDTGTNDLAENVGERSSVPVAHLNHGQPVYIASRDALLFVAHAVDQNGITDLNINAPVAGIVAWYVENFSTADLADPAVYKRGAFFLSSQSLGRPNPRDSFGDAHLVPLTSKDWPCVIVNIGSGPVGGQINTPRMWTTASTVEQVYDAVAGAEFVRAAWSKDGFGEPQWPTTGAWGRFSDWESEWTLSAWIKIRFAGETFPADALVGEQVLFTTQQAALTDQGVSVSMEDDTIRVRMVGSGADQTLTATQVVTDDIDSGDWVLLVVTNDGAKGLAIYVGEDGGSLSTYASPTVVEGADPLTTGDDTVPGAGVAMFAPVAYGAVSEHRFVHDLRIWDRALDAAQVAQLYAGQPVTG